MHYKHYLNAYAIIIMPYGGHVGLMEKTDIDICNYLNKNSRASNREIARELSLSQATVKNRLEILHKKGIISHSTILNSEKFDDLFLAVVGITVQQKGEQILEKISAHPNVFFAALVTGQYSLIAIVLVNSREMLFRVVSQDIEGMPEVSSTHTYVALKHKGLGIPVSELSAIEGMIESLTHS